jgi:hypothetical protein
VGGRSVVEARQILRHLRRVHVKKIHLTSVQETTTEREPVWETQSLEAVPELLFPRPATEPGTRPALARGFEKRMPLRLTKPSDAKLSNANL